jgi:hypothetical protein
MCGSISTAAFTLQCADVRGCKSFSYLLRR